MSTDEFISFCQRQHALDSAERDKLNARVDALATDLAQTHSSRHSAQENLARVVNEMRLDHSSLEKQVQSLVSSMQELVIAMKGSYGGQGLVAQVAELATQIEQMKAAHMEGRGMARLIGWGGGLLGVAAAMKGFLVK